MNGFGNGMSLSAGAPQQELRVDLKSISPFLGWELTPKYNLEWS
jgi:hypothetical protein